MNVTMKLSHGTNLAGGAVGQVATAFDNRHSQVYHGADSRTSRTPVPALDNKPDALLRESCRAIPFTCSDGRGGLQHGLSFRVHDGRRACSAGVLDDAGVFRKRMTEKHLLRVPRAIAVQSTLIEELQARECRALVVTVVESLAEDSTAQVRYVTSLQAFLDHGFPLNRGYGEQLALELRHWTATPVRRTAKGARRE